MKKKLNNIIFMGMKHCGKSTHGKKTADYLGLEFYDTDHLMIYAYKQKTGLDIDIRGIYKKYGETGFRDFEEHVFLGLLKELEKRKQRAVISLGGRLPMNLNLTDALKNAGENIFIKVDPKVLFKRVIRKGIPPFLSKENPEEDFLSMYNERKERYYDLADTIIPLKDQKIEEVFKIIISKLG